MIADIDGGTRIGEALDTLLSIPRYAGFLRGATVVILSDGRAILSGDAGDS
ncbi:MAG: VWA domain-containing protein [Cyanobacteria bacterium P01_F01_bin.42]